MHVAAKSLPATMCCDLYLREMDRAALAEVAAEAFAAPVLMAASSTIERREWKHLGASSAASLHELMFA